MAKKKRKGLLDDDFQSLTYKEKKSKIRDIKIPTIKDTNITGDKNIEYGFAGGKKLGKTDVGAIQTKAQEQNKTTKNGKDTFLDSDGNEVGKFKSEVRDNKSFKGKKNTLGTDKGNKLDRIEKRVAKRQGQKEERKNYRAAKLAKRRGMSPEQAKEFMQNRRNRLNQAMGEFGKGLMGKQQNLGNIENRMYRKKGTGTLQNMKSKDGGTYDATAPYKGTAEKGYADRGLARDETDTYTKIMGPKVNIKPADPIKLTAFRGQKEKKETKEDIVNSNKDKVTGNTDVLNKGSQFTFSNDVSPPKVDTIGGGMSSMTSGERGKQNFSSPKFNEFFNPSGNDSLNQLLNKTAQNPADELLDRAGINSNLAGMQGRSGFGNFGILGKDTGFSNAGESDYNRRIRQKQIKDK